MNKTLFICCLALSLASCTIQRLPPFSSESWHIDSYSGNAKSNTGLEFGFGCEWMITDTALIQTSEQIASFPKLAEYLTQGIRQFPEIVVDSIYFYNPARGLLFVSYHQKKPLKPNTEITLYNDSMAVYSKEFTRIFGWMNTYIEDDGWENGPVESVYSNLHYNKGDKQFVLLQRIPYKDKNIAVFHICSSMPKKGKWWEEYPRGIFWRVDLGNTDNIEHIASYLNSARTVAVSNLQIIQSKE